MRRLKKLFKNSFLSRRNHYLIGAGCAFSIAGNYYRFDLKKAEPEAIMKSMEDDWQAIAKELKFAMRKNLLNHVKRKYSTQIQPGR